MLASEFRQLQLYTGCDALLGFWYEARKYPSTLAGHVNSPEFPLTQTKMVYAIVQRIIRGGPCNPMHMVKLEQGWAQKPPPTKQCTKEVALKRAKWIEDDSTQMLFYIMYVLMSTQPKCR